MATTDSLPRRLSAYRDFWHIPCGREHGESVAARQVWSHEKSITCCLAKALDIDEPATISRATEIAGPQQDRGLPGRRNATTGSGTRWGWGAVGMTLFQTIVPPNSQAYPWNSCRADCAGCSADDSVFSNAQSNHSGGVRNLRCSPMSVKFVKASTCGRGWHWDPSRW